MKLPENTGENPHNGQVDGGRGVTAGHAFGEVLAQRGALGGKKSNVVGLEMIGKPW